MKLFTARCLVTIATALGSLSAVAQTRFCLGGDLSHLSQAERTSCSAKLQAAKAEATALHAPDSWHFVMVCGAEGWNSYTAFVGGDNASLVTASANTDLGQGETFLRADKIDLNNPSSLQKIVAHEVAGIMLRSSDELAINRQLKIWDQAAGHTGF